MKTVTIRLPQELADWLTVNGDSLNQSMISTVDTLRRIRLVSAGELKGVFTQNEWKFLADSLNGVVIDATFRCNVSALIAHCEDAASYDDAAMKWDITLSDLASKIGMLKGANIEAIYSRIEQFWKNNLDIEEWANY